MTPGPDLKDDPLEAHLDLEGRGETVLACNDLTSTLEFFVGRLGFRVETIYPADDPRVACLSGHGLNLRLEPGEGDPGTLRLALKPEAPAQTRELLAPNGTRIILAPADPPLVVPPLQPEFVLRRARDSAAAGEGRAGMLYRDLIPGRLGGRYIASHISIPDGGPVKDWVHFHKIAFQLIYCRRGWVRVVYEDQGDPFVLHPGDCVLQPPQIRHRVLESSPGLEVVELGSPALHETLADHALALPTGVENPGRVFGGQRFARHVAAEAPWRAEGEGFERQETCIATASGGAVSVSTLRAAGGSTFTGAAHNVGLFFVFILAGRATLEFDGQAALGADDAFALPPGRTFRLADASQDLCWIEITAPTAGDRIRAEP